MRLGASVAFAFNSLAQGPVMRKVAGAGHGINIIGIFLLMAFYFYYGIGIYC